MDSCLFVEGIIDADNGKGFGGGGGSGGPDYEGSYGSPAVVLLEVKSK